MLQYFNIAYLCTMAELGKYNSLEIIRFRDQGAYVDGEDLGEILVPQKYLDDEDEEGDFINVFVHLDGEERYVATTENVLAEVGEVAFMEITHINDHGAFADWGLTKNLFIPYREQRQKMRSGDYHPIFVYVDELTNRLVGSSKIERHLDHDKTPFREKEKVKILIYKKTPAGYTCIIENKAFGLLYSSDVFTDIEVGEYISAYIKKIREDEKIDLTLNQEGYDGVRDFSDILLEYLEENKTCHLHDKSSPDDIRDLFGVSKKIFKKAVGKLYKEKKIELSQDGIKLL